MQKPLHLLLYGVASCALALAIVLPMAKHSPERVERKYGLMLQEGKRFDHQLWGTSHVAHGIQPSRFDARYQNLAFQSSNPSFYRAWYLMWRRHHPPPQQIVLALDTFVFHRFSFSRDIDQDGWAWPWPEIWAKLMGAPTRVFAYNLLPPLRHRKTLQSQLAFITEAEAYMAPERYDQGFFPLNKAFGQEALPPPDFQAKLCPPDSALPGKEYTQDPDFSRDLVWLLDTLLNEGVRVCAIQTPYFRGLSASEKATNRKLASLLAQRRIPWVNFNEEAHSDINRQQAFYSDETHLNGWGAGYFSAFLAGFLKQRGLL